MHSSRPRSRREKLLIDMDRIRKPFANFTGGEGGLGRATRDEKTLGGTEGEINRETDTNRDTQIERQSGRANKTEGNVKWKESERKEVGNTESVGKQKY